ncbi:COG3014 family protein [Engelhardtia mirabilis]|uniref:Tetratricopeptide repeat protein n=1 Tax=Engelhardtia mirabilis TaxID=2528011 RepID=A0A518BFM7_9BACT|nr:hypothetical protein Pla133_08410 [Planctomycetes bacterium Pla133]QDV00101.1 hypothetical protein Pla86_08400 [Planctomycetes bacterium Pla86]
MPPLSFDRNAPCERPSAISRLGALALASVLASCASYPDRYQGALDDLRGGRFSEAASAFEDKAGGFLGAAEAGTIRFAAGDWETAERDLLRAAELADGFDAEAPITAGGVTEDLGSLLVNESVRTYEGEGFERVQVHGMLALTFLAQGKLEDALVEARRANQRLEREEKLYETDYEAGGLGHFVSALCYELRGELGDTLIDYQRMDEKGLAPSLVGPELGRVAAVLRREDVLAELEPRFGPAPVVPEGSARVVLIAGVGLVPFKSEDSLKLVTPAGVVAWAIPKYVERPQPVSSVELVIVDHGQTVRSTVIEDVGAVAERNLSDRIAILATRSGARAASRTVLAKQLRDSDKQLAALAVDIFSLATENADRRSWLTLPNTWQVAQAFVPAGPLTLAVDALGGLSIDFEPIVVSAGETVIVLARTVDRSLFAHIVGGGQPLVEAAPPQEPDPAPSPEGDPSAASTDEPFI